ncbi:hypothetical protein E1A91_A11G238500v1 [Gossypium mustelinum]|nr:hypothetical protein E1A91_A11G238500v1 [Gossypium mustelinum]
MGHHVTVISSSEKKKVEALEHLHADAFLVSSNAAEMEGAAASLHYILDTVPAFHSLDPYISLLKAGGNLIFVGVSTKPLHFNSVDLNLGKKPLTGSFIGSMLRNTGNTGFLGREGTEYNDRGGEDGLYKQGF